MREEQAPVRAPLRLLVDAGRVLLVRRRIRRGRSAAPQVGRSAPVRFAYADPPYLGCCKLYEHYHPDGRCWDDLDTHAALIERLIRDFPDGWALSASERSLRALLPLCPPEARTAPWVKSFCAFKRGVRPAHAWEPVIFWRGRNPSNGHKHPPPEKGGKQTTPKDFVVAPITMKRGLTGAKPEAVCKWVLDLLGFRPGDAVVDLYSGTGTMGQVVYAAGGRAE